MFLVWVGLRSNNSMNLLLEKALHFPNSLVCPHPQIIFSYIGETIEHKSNLCVICPNRVIL